MASPEASCYTLVFDDASETPTTSDLRSALQKGSDEVKCDTLRKIIVSTINGNPQVCLLPILVKINSKVNYHVPARHEALAVDAHHPICYALTKQATQEAASLLLGGLPEVRREWEA